MNALLNKLQEWYYLATSCAGIGQHDAIRLIVQALFCQFIKRQLPALFFIKQPDYTVHPFFNQPLFHTVPEIPDTYLFSEAGLYTILAQYDFSLTDPAAILPDVLGFVHESLLAHIKTDTQNARKETGSFYTPVEITDYMISMTLDEFQRRGGDLRTCTILDPAVGCGEFPIRLFKEICRRINPDTQTKLQILNNLYGTDIQPLAIHITLARILLTLLHNNVTTPIDLSHNFIVADALLGYKPPVQFDIVIGNPPYIQIQNNNGLLAKRYQQCRYKMLAGRGDIYILFYERGLQLLKPHGLLCYITSNKWLRATYGDKFRRYINAHANPLKLLNFEHVELFKSASITTCILLLANEPNRHAPFAYNVKHFDDLKSDIQACLPHQKNSQWILLSEIEQSIKTKIETLGSPLSRWHIKIQEGIKTGCDEAYVIDGAKRQELIAADPKSAEIIKPFLRGRDISPHGYTFNDKWLLTLFPCLHINLDDYPAVKEHLLPHYDVLHKMHSYPGRARLNYKWYEMSNTNLFWRNFIKTKIIFPLLTQEACFCVDDSGIYLNSACGMILTVYPHYLCAILSSPLYEYAIKNFLTLCTLGQTYYNNINTLLNLPVINPSVEQRIHIETLFKNKDDRLNYEIYKMYNLTPDEIAVIEGVSADTPQ